MIDFKMKLRRLRQDEKILCRVCRDKPVLHKSPIGPFLDLVICNLIQIIIHTLHRKIIINNIKYKSIGYEIFIGRLSYTESYTKLHNPTQKKGIYHEHFGPS